MYLYEGSFFDQQKETAQAATTPPANTWLPQTNLDYASFYGSPSPGLCKSPQWVCYGDYVLLKLPNYTDSGLWFGPWWTVHTCNFMAQLAIGTDDSIGNPSYSAAWNAYGLFLTPYYYEQGQEGYDHLRTSMAMFQIVPYGSANSSPCNPGTSPMCSNQPWYGQPVCSGDTVYLQWNMLCTHNNPTYCEVPYCWGNISGNTARVAWYTDSKLSRVDPWPLYISQNYQIGSTNTASGNSCILYDLPQLCQLTSTDSSNPNNQVYMQNNSWTNDDYTLFTVTGGSTGSNISYGDSITFAPYNLSGYSVVYAPLATQSQSNHTNPWQKILPLQFLDQLVIQKGNATAFQIMPATNPLVSSAPAQQLFCFDSPGKCTGNKPTCLHGEAGCVAGTWQCLSTIYGGCSCPLTKCDASGYCLSPSGQLPTKTVNSAGQCSFVCNKSLNPYMYFLLPALIVIIFIFLFFVM